MKKLLLLSLLFIGFPSLQSNCEVFSGGSLQSAINANQCVYIPNGVYEIEAPIIIPSNKTITGESRDGVILKAVGTWSNPYAGILNTVTANISGVNISNLTLDGNDTSILGIAARGMTLDNLRIKGAKCSGVSIAGNTQMVIKNSIIENNGADCQPYPPGAGIYAEGTASSLNPVITNNLIINNTGPALDVNKVWGGVFSDNIVTGNTGWAAVSLFGSSNWLINKNVIVHLDTDEVQPYHPECQKGHSAGIFLCQVNDTGNAITAWNTIKNNRVSSWYGILLIGNDETQPYWIPRLNNVLDNSLFGSVVGCADDYEAGQWYNTDNIWTGNSCTVERY